MDHSPFDARTTFTLTGAAGGVVAVEVQRFSDPGSPLQSVELRRP